MHKIPLCEMKGGLYNLMALCKVAIYQKMNTPIFVHLEKYVISILIFQPSTFLFCINKSMLYSSAR